MVAPVPPSRTHPLLGRRRSSSALCKSSDETTSRPAKSSSVTMLFNLLPQQKTPLAEDESILPLSAASKVSFDDSELIPPRRSFQLPQLTPELLFVLLLFPFTTGLVAISLWSLPITSPWPHNLSDLAQLGRELQSYGASGPGSMFHILCVLSLSAVWKHAWSIPGSVVWNVLAGALWSPFYAAILLTALTSIGSVCSSMLAKPLAPLLSTYMPKVLDMGRQALQGHDIVTIDAPPFKVEQDVSVVPELAPATDEAAPISRREKFRLRLKRRAHSTTSNGTWARLSVLRLVGVVPWMGINIACGVLDVPVLDCLLGAFVGCLPWTAVTCQIGDILQAVASSPSGLSDTDNVSSLLLSREVVVKLALLSFLSLSPILGRNYLKALMNPPSLPSAISPAGEKPPRWPKLRSVAHKIRHSRNPTQELHDLVQEKRAMEKDFS
ncbi:hypothetical protein DL96DRAFT_1707351 [Flagelloscypha sp. PMI_526]|nr:hypothetical protein DL96DRAFT_1707351 [Flagelloscypha sp. PMI_526]